VSVSVVENPTKVEVQLEDVGTRNPSLVALGARARVLREHTSECSRVCPNLAKATSIWWDGVMGKPGKAWAWPCKKAGQGCRTESPVCDWFNSVLPGF